jgi:hypothetical protein
VFIDNGVRLFEDMCAEANSNHFKYGNEEADSYGLKSNRLLPEFRLPP